MQKRLLFNSKLLQITISRLCQHLIENHGDFSDSVILGLQPRGIYLAERVRKELESILGKPIQVGYLDTTFHRDDFRRRDHPLTPYETKVPFLIENKRVVLIDDVLFTGRSVRAALDAMTTFGRPTKVELLVLIDRMYSRDIPVEANYVGRRVNTMKSQRVLVELQEQGTEEDNIWLINEPE
ncbi:bifunctional pyr operon transcriptional regulator/uracil phosphoribosyltransferase PyrR [Marinoscillum furvescens]|uniref:Pyrimidine operon attenuation protein/uracil phosphoribosyltransferase n=1 Tax=Marinoscillum furvescens DSM 4134 TaxID=1122208 RepID=A0A3D9LGP7_MARFU|nr:bifunctional pyr operon transcriptional regulator/uracil phosphoribosyltransferase PyrR [Marinoscillum furvescens]REE05818.1 pyrimidine operon attenuation protein/uracil phosphoribosyltransferase [Marinoscillum furvescens DSM 4134]